MRTIERTLHFVTFLIGLATTLLLIKITWIIIFEQRFVTNDCECLCADERFSMANLEVTLRYRGKLDNATECRCASFLLPKISDSLKMRFKPSPTLCERCRCSELAIGVEQSFYRYYTAILMAVLISGVLYLGLVSVYSCINRQSSLQATERRWHSGKFTGMFCIQGKAKRQGYEEIGKTII